MCTKRVFSSPWHFKQKVFLNARISLFSQREDFAVFLAEEISPFQLLFILLETVGAFTQAKCIRKWIVLKWDMRVREAWSRCWWMFEASMHEWIALVASTPQLKLQSWSWSTSWDPSPGYIHSLSALVDSAKNEEEEIRNSHPSRTDDGGELCKLLSVVKHQRRPRACN